MNTKPQLEITLPSDTQIQIQRDFHFAKHLVYRAFADSANHDKWVGCGMGTCTLSTGKPEIGEPWHFKMEIPEMGEMHLFGQCLEAVQDEKLVRTFIYNVPGIRECPSVETATFTEQNGVTTLKIVIQHFSKENRDGHLQSGMEEGVTASYDRLEEYLGEIE